MKCNCCGQSIGWLKAVVFVAILALGWPINEARAEQGDITVHTVSHHLQSDGLNNVNPGVAYDVTDHIRVGALYNSYKNPGAYVAAIYPMNDRVRIGAGLISWYKFQEGTIAQSDFGVIPMVAVEVDIIQTKRYAVSGIWFGETLNLQIKFRR